MPEPSEVGIPDIKKRLDGSESAKQWNNMREAVMQIHRSGVPTLPVPMIPPFPKQFTLFQNPDGEIQLGEGVLMFTQRADDGTENASGVTDHALSSWFLVPEVIGSPLDEDPLVFPVAADTDYGFWLKIKHVVSGNDSGEGRNSAVGNTQLDEYVIDTEVFYGGADYQLPGTGTDLVESTVSYSYIYLGKAEVDENKVAKITQKVFGPITVPAITYLDGLIEGTQDDGRETFLGIGDERGITTTSNVESGSNDIFEASTGKIYLRIKPGEGGATNVEIERESPEDGEPRVFLNEDDADSWDDKADAVGGDPVDHGHDG